MTPGQRRRYDLDWLRVGATFRLFPFHVAKTFDVLPMYHIKNAVLSPGLDYFTAFIHQWHMPLFFVLAGWSACASIQATLRFVLPGRAESLQRLGELHLLQPLLRARLSPHPHASVGGCDRQRMEARRRARSAFSPPTSIAPASRAGSSARP